MSEAATNASNVTEDASKFSTFTGIIKGIAGIASLALAPETGGASLAIGGAKSAVAIRPASADCTDAREPPERGRFSRDQPLFLGR